MWVSLSQYVQAGAGVNACLKLVVGQFVIFQSCVPKCGTHVWYVSHHENLLLEGRMITVTLSDIRRHSPCKDRWKHLLGGLGVTRSNKKPLPLERILELNGLWDALWALRAVARYDGAIRLFACYCAKYSLDIFEREYPDDKRPREAIEVAERFARGLATQEELAAAEDAAWGALAAAWAAAEAAGAAGYAAWAAAEAAAWDDFEREFIRVCRLEGEYAAFREIAQRRIMPTLT
jgi:hypothetical protein